MAMCLGSRRRRSAPWRTATPEAGGAAAKSGHCQRRRPPSNFEAPDIGCPARFAGSVRRPMCTPAELLVRKDTPTMPKFSRRMALALAVPIMLCTAPPAQAAPLWHPDPATDGLKAFEGIEADRSHHHPDRKYVVVEGDHYRFPIWKDARDTTGGGDRQRTESKGMVQGGTALKMHDGETWTLSYEMY